MTLTEGRSGQVEAHVPFVSAPSQLQAMQHRLTEHHANTQAHAVCKHSQRAGPDSGKRNMPAASVPSQPQATRNPQVQPQSAPNPKARHEQCTMARHRHQRAGMMEATSKATCPLEAAERVASRVHHLHNPNRNNQGLTCAHLLGLPHLDHRHARDHAVGVLRPTPQKHSHQELNHAPAWPSKPQSRACPRSRCWGPPARSC